MNLYYFELSAEEKALCTIRELADDLEARTADPLCPIMKWERKRPQAEELLDGVENPTGNLLLLKRLFETVRGLIYKHHDVPDLEELLDSAAKVTAGTEYEYVRRIRS